MSILSSLVVFLVLAAAVSLHACHARRLGVAIAKEIEKDSLVPNKNEKKLNDAKPSLEPKPTEKEELQSRNNEDTTMKQVRVEEDNHNDTTEKKEFEESKDQSIDESETEQSLESVSWKIPHKKRGERQPGFNLDYSPPKTHPPSHN